MSDYIYALPHSEENKNKKEDCSKGAADAETIRQTEERINKGTEGTNEGTQTTSHEKTYGRDDKTNEKGILLSAIARYYYEKSREVGKMFIKFLL